MLSFWRTSLIAAFSFSSSADFLADHRLIVLTNWPTVRAEPFRPSANLVECSPLPSIDRLYSIFSLAASSYPF
jgi:hypothetical protein